MMFTTHNVHRQHTLPHWGTPHGRTCARPCQAALTQLAPGEYKAVVHLTGGAFAAAAPNLVVRHTHSAADHVLKYLHQYSLLGHLLSNAGYTVIATPFAVTFQHALCTQQVHQAFFDTLTAIRAEGLQWLAPEGLPTVGVGHSNGALLQLLMGSMQQPLHDAAVIISYNNREVGGAIPVPLDTLKPIADSIAAANAPPTDVLAMVVQPLVAAGVLAPAQVGTLAPLVGQLQDVFGEVGQGIGDFVPTPAESRRIIADQYAVRSTLLVGFEDDSIDQTPEMAALLGKDNNERNVQVLTLPGSHVTPCGGDTGSGSLLGPLTLSAQADVRRLVACIRRWMDAAIVVDNARA